MISSKKQQGTILVGESEELFAFYSGLAHPERVLGVFCSLDAALPGGLERIGDVEEVAAFLDNNTRVTRVYCSMALSLQQIREVQYGCKARAVKFCLLVPIINELDVDFMSVRVGKKVMLTPKNEPLSLLHNRVLKRCFDLFLVLLYMLTIFPFVYLVKSFLIKRKKRQSSFSYQRCCGPNGRVFKQVNFRGQERSQARLFNVLRGNMSLVGPACYVLADEDEPSSLPKRLLRREVKPGMTGWAQVKGLMDEGRLDADIWYVENWSLWLDIRILFKALIWK